MTNLDPASRSEGTGKGGRFWIERLIISSAGELGVRVTRCSFKKEPRT